jgi:hypothetical protein
MVVIRNSISHLFALGVMVFVGCDAYELFYSFYVDKATQLEESKGFALNVQ